MRIVPTKLNGCFELWPDRFEDHRGVLIKTFHCEVFRWNGLEARFEEQYYSRSTKGVLRGLHFQVPPFDHAKLVSCIHGRILDAAVDLRLGSPTRGRHVLLELNADAGNMLYIPAGMAHGFYAVSDTATVVNLASRIYSPAHEGGIRWDSAGIPWPDPQPIVSEKDGQLPPLSGFAAPFRYKGGSDNGG